MNSNLLVFPFPSLIILRGLLGTTCSDVIKVLQVSWLNIADMYSLTLRNLESPSEPFLLQRLLSFFASI